MQRRSASPKRLRHPFNSMSAARAKADALLPSDIVQPGLTLGASCPPPNDDEDTLELVDLRWHGPGILLIATGVGYCLFCVEWFTSSVSIIAFAVFLSPLYHHKTATFAVAIFGLGVCAVLFARYAVQIACFVVLLVYTVNWTDHLVRVYELRHNVVVLLAAYSTASVSLFYMWSAIYYTLVHCVCIWFGSALVQSAIGLLVENADVYPTAWDVLLAKWLERSMLVWNRPRCALAGFAIAWHLQQSMRHLGL